MPVERKQPGADLRPRRKDMPIVDQLDIADRQHRARSDELFPGLGFFEEILVIGRIENGEISNRIDERTLRPHWRPLRPEAAEQAWICQVIGAEEWRGLWQVWQAMPGGDDVALTGALDHKPSAVADLDDCPGPVPFFHPSGAAKPLDAGADRDNQPIGAILAPVLVVR